MAGRLFQVRLDDRELSLEVLEFERAAGERPGRLTARLGEREVSCGYRPEGPGRLRLTLAGRSVSLRFAEDGPARLLGCQAAALRVEPIRRRPGPAAGREPPREVTPPMPAVVVAVLVTPGELVRAGQPAMVVSAMKMEATLAIPRDGRVAEVRAKVGDRVSPGDVLVSLEPLPAPPPGGKEPRA